MSDQQSFIPFLDLRKVNTPYHEKLKESFSDFLDTGVYIRGRKVKDFEDSFASFCGSDHCIGVANGLDALTLILKGYIALGKLQLGDEVIVTANTFIATILSVRQAGLIPVFVEPDEDTYTIDVNCIKQHITAHTKAIIPTHLYGQLAAMNVITTLAKHHDLLVISDAAQAHGAKSKDNKKAGSLSDASSFSFYPVKNLGAFGDAGAITTDDTELSDIIRSISNYGFSEKYVSEYEGVNSRLDELQASFLLEKLKDVDRDAMTRRSIASKYKAGINNAKIQLPFWDKSDNHVFHLFVVRVADRPHFCDYLEKSGIGYLIHYPIPPHKQKAFAEFSKLSLPITERMHREVVSIPLNIGLGDSDVEYIISVLNQY